MFRAQAKKWFGTLLLLTATLVQVSNHCNCEPRERPRRFESKDEVLPPPSSANKIANLLLFLLFLLLLDISDLGSQKERP
jgi:hypothetical protein